MIPSLVAGQLRNAIVEYLSTTFALSDDNARVALAEFLDTGDNGIFRGPYLRVRTPFRKADDGWRNPLSWTPEWFKPYEHQAKAWERLSSHNHDPQPTLVTTGTGSGKTESFLIPILDNCIRARASGQRGVKALLLYPMNALATDQAGRLAKLINGESALNGVTAGIYIGENGPNTSMGPDHLIDDRHAMRADPPDILLTNYKMLDFLLLRNDDQDLWAGARDGGLRYVVLDEFHTYDGAQGTDVAMLLRRLGSTLGLSTSDRPLGDVCPVGTSATLGSGPTATDALREFAGRVFGTAFGDDSIIGESRQTPDEACGTIDFALPIPEVEDVLELEAHDYDGLAALFLDAQAPLRNESVITSESQLCRGEIV